MLMWLLPFLLWSFGQLGLSSAKLCKVCSLAVKYVLKHSQCCDSALASLLQAVILYPSTRAESELGMWNKSRLSETCTYSKSQCNATFRTTSFVSASAGQISMPEMSTAHISAYAFGASEEIVTSEEIGLCVWLEVWLWSFWLLSVVTGDWGLSIR